MSLITDFTSICNSISQAAATCNADIHPTRLDSINQSFLTGSGFKYDSFFIRQSLIICIPSSYKISVITCKGCSTNHSIQDGFVIPCIDSIGKQFINFRQFFILFRQSINMSLVVLLKDTECFQSAFHISCRKSFCKFSDDCLFIFDIGNFDFLLCVFKHVEKLCTDFLCYSAVTKEHSDTENSTTRETFDTIVLNFDDCSVFQLEY